MFCQLGAQQSRYSRNREMRAALLVVLLGAASGLSPVRFGAKAWQRRGVYAGRSDMPRVADVAAAVGAPAPWQVSCSTRAA
jgi:hypothetical protein